MAKRVLVAGGGIGGLAAGIALQRAGFEVNILERAARAREVGSGILIQPNGARALEALGVPLIAAGGLTRLTLRTWRGRHLNEVPFSLFRERHGFGVEVVPRSSLHSQLLETLGRDRVTSGAEVGGFAEADGRVTVALRDGRKIEADLLIGADGLRSAVRAQLLGDSEPNYLGCTAWRGMTDISGTGLESGQGLSWWGPGGEFGALPMQDLVYWFATANAAPGEAIPPGRRLKDLLDRFGNWQAPIPELMTRTEPAAILRNDVYDRPPVRSWTKGRVTLLGDAAHPMAPNAAQGACQALEDAVALGTALTHEPDLEAGLLRYQHLRLRRANEFVRLSRRTSAAIQSENRFLSAARNLGARLMPAGLMLRQLDRTLSGT